MTFTKPAPRSTAVRTVAEHQAVTQSLVTLTVGAGELVLQGASRGPFMVLLSIASTQLAVAESVTGSMPVSHRHVLELLADR